MEDIPTVESTRFFAPENRSDTTHLTHGRQHVRKPAHHASGGGMTSVAKSAARTPGEDIARLYYGD